jgi:hypothetical protein
LPGAGLPGGSALTDLNTIFPCKPLVMPEQQLLNEYLKKLARLRQAPTAYGPAPHKPVLLLTLFDGIEKGWITANRVFLTPELVAAFRDHWSVLVDTHHSPEFTLPFFHLQSSGFWRVVRHDGQPWQDFTKSLPRMQELVHYGTLDDALYALLLDPITRNVLRVALLDRYFPATKAAYLQRKDTGGYLNDMENELLGEPAVAYAAALGEADEEEAFVQGGLFNSEASKWRSSNQTIAKVHLKQKKSNGEDYIYEFYCYIRVICDLICNYNIEFVDGRGRFQYAFPQAPSPKEGKPYFVAKDKNSSEIKFQICAGTEIATTFQRSPAPDISFQKPESPENPTFENVLMIFDAKFNRSNSDKDKVGLNQLYYVSGMIRDLRIENAFLADIMFDELSELKGNCILTNGEACNTDFEYHRSHNLKEVEKFDANKTFNVIG